MNLELADKIALVTGASSGIGAATAQVLAEEGADVVVAYGQDDVGAGRCAQIVESLGRRAWLCPMDIRRPDAVTTAVERLKTEIDKLDILILCAGYNKITPLQEITPDEWDQVLDVNLSGVFYVVQAILPLLKPGASIVAVASVAAQTGAPQHMHYAAAKAGLVNLTKSLARTLAPGIRVNCVSPGVALTPMGQATVENLPADYARSKLLVQRFATPEEIARCIVFVASPMASFMTGATIDINGGRDMR
ncbi:MAG: SDR family oxidoreductase [Caldilineales bacterium]|nr:SDR family oxidoreductase [Caldilineales bacterium]